MIARFALLSALIAAPSIAGAQESFESARLKFEEGLRLLDSQDFAPAAKAFEESLALRKALPAYYNLALAYQGMGKVKLALAALSDLLQLASAQNAPRDAAEAERLMEELRRSLAQLTIVLVSPSDRVLVDGETISMQSQTQLLSLDPTDHIIEAQREGYEPDRHLITLQPASSARVELDVSKRPLFGTLLIETDHPQAQISIDGVPAGRGTHRGKLSTGRHRLEVVLAGADPAKQEVQIVAGAEARIFVAIQPADPIVKKWWFWAAIATAAAAGTAVALVAAKSEQPPSGGSLEYTVQALTR